MTARSQYRRLPGRAGFLVRHSLWMGPGHLLSVRAQPFSETYRRFYFPDIQALVLTELSSTAEFSGYGIALLITVLTAGLAYSRHPAWAVFCGVIAAAVFLWSWSRPNCACTLRTRVGGNALPSLKRLRSARKTLAMLKEEIEKVQGVVTPEAVNAFTSSEIGLPARAAPELSLRHCEGKAHWAMFILAVVWCGAGTAVLLTNSNSTPLGLVTGAVNAAVLIAAVFAALQQRRSDLPSPIRWLVYLTLAWYPLGAVIGIAINFYIVVQLGPKAATPAAIVSHPLVRTFSIANLASYFILGCAGLILLWRRHLASRTPPPLTLENKGLDAG